VDGDNVLPELGNEIICGVEARLNLKYQNIVVHFSVTDFGRKFYCKNIMGSEILSKTYFQ
jgi:hypothetical protein